MLGMQDKSSSDGVQSNSKGVSRGFRARYGKVSVEGFQRFQRANRE